MKVCVTVQTTIVDKMVGAYLRRHTVLYVSAMNSIMEQDVRPTEQLTQQFHRQVMVDWVEVTCWTSEIL